MVSDAELSDAMLGWAQRVIRHLSGILHDTSIIGHGGTGWVYNQDGKMVRGFRNVHFKHGLIEKLQYENKEWENLEKLTQKHARMAMHCDRLVGTPCYSDASQFSAKDFCYRLLPRPSIADGGICLEDVEGTVGRIADLISEFNANQISIKTVWPISGIRVKQPIRLDSEQSFRSLTVAEKISALNFKMIVVDEGRTTIDTSLTDWFGYVLTERFTKCFGDGVMPEDITEEFYRREKCLELFLSVAPIVGEFVAYHGGGITHAPHFSSAGLLSSGESGHLAGHGGSRFLIPTLNPTLTDEQATRFVNVWKLVSKTSPNNNRSAKALRNAVRRMHYAEKRISPEDRLIDLMIAAESIYTMESQAELAFRLSLNVALWHDGTNLERRSAFDEMKKAYSLRSKIVHGSAVDSSQVALAASNVRRLLKVGIGKAIDSHFSGEYPPKWEDLAFPKLV